MSIVRLEGLNTVRELLAGLGPALQKANERSQNKMAYELMKAERDQAKTDLNWPTPAFISSIQYKKYGVKDLLLETTGAGVYMSDFIGGGGDRASFENVAGVQIIGGMPAGPKRSEVILMQRGFMRPDQTWVPAEVAPRDKYGNIPGSEWSAALTNLGFNQYAQLVQARQWYIAGKPGNYIGIWKKVTDPSKPGQWQPWVYFVPRKNYSERFKWIERADMEIAAQFESILDWYVTDELKKMA